MQIGIKPIRSKGHSSNPLKKRDLILKVPLRQAHYHFFVFPHEIIQLRYIALKIAVNCFKLILF